MDMHKALANTGGLGLVKLDRVNNLPTKVHNPPATKRNICQIPLKDGPSTLSDDGVGVGDSQ